MTRLVYEGEKPLRLDKFILQRQPQLGFGLLQKYLRQNKIKLNGRRQPLSTPLAAGDEVLLYLPEKQAAPHPLAVLFEDENLLAAYKPAGLVSLYEDGAGGVQAGKTDSLARRAAAYLRAGSPAAKALPCHRLDTGTSGVLLFAKNEATLDFVTGLLQSHQLAKTYTGLCFGHPQPASGVLDGWLRKDAAKGLVRLAPPGAQGARPAETRYETIATQGPLALLRLHPQTGRTHQIRAHLAAAGAPLLGDSKYGDNAANRRYRCRYQCLCAIQLRFPALSGAHAAYSRLVISCGAPWFTSLVSK